MTRQARVLFAGLLLALLPALPGVAQTPSSAHVMTEEYFESLDGTRLHAYLYRPAWVGDDPTPVILSVTPYAGSTGHLIALRFDPLHDPATNRPSGAVMTRGYTFVEVSLRGTGASAGCNDLGGADEQADVRAAIEWARAQPWSNGKVALQGFSYPGQTGLMSLGNHDEDFQGPDAVVTGAPPIGYAQVYQDGVRTGWPGLGYTFAYDASTLFPPSAHSSPDQHTNALGKVTARPGCPPPPVVGSQDRDPQSAFWQSRDLPELAAGNEVPTIFYQGFDDYLVRPNNILPVLDALAPDNHVILGPWDHNVHSRPNTIGQLALDWFDHHLRGLPRPELPPVLVLHRDSSWRAEEQWPPVDVVPWPAPVRPGAYLDVPGNHGQTGYPDVFHRIPPFDSVREQGLQPNGVGSWSITHPLPHDVHLSGEPELAIALLAASPSAHVIALLYEIDADGGAHLLSRGAARVRPLGTDVTVTLYPQDRRVPAGSRLALLVSGADDHWFESGGSGQPVQITGGSWQLPLLRYDRSTVLLPPGSGPFSVMPPYNPFPMDEQTLAESTVDAPPPPPMEPFPDDAPACRQPGPPDRRGQPDQAVCRPAAR